MKDKIRKIAVIGTGFVGMSFAYAMLCDGGCDEMVLVDIDEKKAAGEAMDLNHGLAFARENMKIYAGGYADCADADVAVLAAGVSQKPGEDRRALLSRNIEVFRAILLPLLSCGFNGILLAATNPVDVMSRAAWKLSGFDKKRVLGTGTALDSARLRYLLGEKFSVDPKNVHAYVIGEHGDSELCPWSQAYVSTKAVIDILKDRPQEEQEAIFALSKEVSGAAMRVIEAKKATYYGIGLALLRIVKAILSDEKSILTVSTLLQGEYGEEDVFVGVPAVITKNGVREVVSLSLTPQETQQFHLSCETLRQLGRSVGL